MKSSFVVGLLGVTLAGSRGMGQTATVTVPDAPSCAKCTINVRPIVSMGAVDGPGSLVMAPFSVKVDARGRYWITQDMELPLVFDPTGRFVQAVGRKGDGPGEFRSPSATMPLIDSVVVFDTNQQRATVVGPDLKPVRSMSFPPGLGSGALITWPSLVFMRNGAYGGREGPPPPIAGVSFAASEVKTLSAFGPDHGALDPKQPLFQILSEAHAGHVWSADAYSMYRISQWSFSGSLLRSLERKPEWFVNPSDGSKRSMASPHTRAIEEDSEGLVWVFMSVSRPGWRDAVPKMGPGGGEIAMRNIAYEKLLRTTVEVIDPRTARVVARRDLDEWIIAALPNGRAAAYSVDDQGTARVNVVQMTLTGR